MHLKCTDCGARIERKRFAGRAPKYCPTCRAKRQAPYRRNK